MGIKEIDDFYAKNSKQEIKMDKEKKTYVVLEFAGIFVYYDETEKYRR